MKKINSIIAILFLFGLLSCNKDFLDEELQSDFSPAALTDELGFNAALVGLQNQYSVWHTYLTNQGWLGVWQIGTDVAFNKSPADNDPWMVPYTNYENLNSTDPAALFTWRWAYKIISNANTIIVNLEDKEVNLTEEKKNAIGAEAKFYRGLAYNTLVTAFGEVPLITEPVEGPKTDFTRASLAELDQLIEADLKFAIANLPAIEAVPANAKGKQYSRAHKSMASHQLAEAYLRMGRNADAEAQCDAVINSGEFSLVTARYGVKAGQPGDPFSDMFHLGNQRRSQGNTEAIWTLEFEDPFNVVGGTGSNLPPTAPAATGFPQHRRMWVTRYFGHPGMVLADSLGGRGISRIALSYWVLNSLYDEGDMRNSRWNIRRDWYINKPGDPNFGMKVDVTQPGVDTSRFLVPYTMKWGHFKPSDPFGAGMYKDVILMRLAETYLFKAEAQFKQGKLADAAETLNIVRARANAAPVSAASVTLDFILDERARELVAEENRRLTLMRTGTLLDRVQGRGVKITGIDSKHLLLPIPQQEIDLNKDANLEQNPGY